MDERLLIYAALGLLYYGYKHFSRASKAHDRAASENKAGKEKSTGKRPYGSPLDPSIPFERNFPEEVRPVYTPLEKEAASLETSQMEWTNYETDRQKIQIEEINPYEGFRTTRPEEEDMAAAGERFDEYLLKPKENKYQILFKDKSSIRNAFIMQEILKRKS